MKWSGYIIPPKSVWEAWVVVIEDENGRILDEYHASSEKEAEDYIDNWREEDHVDQD